MMQQPISAHRSSAVLIGLLIGTTALCVAATFAAFSAVAKPIDFLVYRGGAEAVLTGGNPYTGMIEGGELPPGGMPFTYTPFAALALIPTALIPAELGGWRTAYALWTLANLGVVAWVIHRFTPQARRRWPLLAGLFVAAVLNSVLMQHVIFGQINLLLMALVLVDNRVLAANLSTRWLPSGLLTGIAAAVKLTPALFIAYYAASRQWRKLWWALLGAAGATLVAAAFLPQISWTFWTETVWHLDAQVGFMQNGTISSGNNSVPGVLAAVTGASAPVRLGIAGIIALAGLLLAARLHHRALQIPALLTVGLLATMVSPISWMHHWVYLLPAALWLLFREPPSRTRTAWVAGFYLLTAIGPYLCDAIITVTEPGTIHYTGPWVFWPFSWLCRESFLLAGVACLGSFWHVTRATTTRHPERSGASH